MPKTSEDKNIITIKMTVEEFNQVMDMLSELSCDKGKYGTYEELSKKYEDLWKDYVFVSKNLSKLAYQNMMLEKAREAYKYIIEGDNE